MNTSWRKRGVLCVALALPVLALPVIGHADTVTANAVHRCTQAMAAHLQMRVTGSHYNGQYQDPLQVLVPQQKLKLTARNVHSGRVLATAVCKYDRSGQVVSIAPQPAEATPAPFQH